MSQPVMTNPPRRRRAQVCILGTTQMHLRNPIVIGLWSAIFPGLGHLLLSKYILGIILFLWEVFINLESHLNLAIYYTFTGQAELAKLVLDQRWMTLYLPTYLFAIWDSYRTSVDMNNQYLLAVREDAPVQPFTIHPLGINYLDKGSPLVALVWSMLSPGVGQLIIHRIIVAFFLLALWIVIMYYSRALPVVHHTLLGQFDLARETADKQWFLNIPSVCFFAMYDAYINTVESNNLFEWEQGKYLKNTYQSQAFRMPVGGGKGAYSMYIISNFQHSVKLEIAITTLEMKGIPRDNILAVPLDKKNEQSMLFDRIHYSDSTSLFDFPIILAALFALLGIIYGFVLPMGPILWALIGTGLGFGIGLLVKLLVVRKRNGGKPGLAEVVLIITCEDTQLQMAQDILWDNGALGVSKLLYEPAAGR